MAATGSCSCPPGAAPQLVAHFRNESLTCDSQGTAGLRAGGSKLAKPIYDILHSHSHSLALFLSFAFLFDLCVCFADGERLKIKQQKLPYYICNY